MRNTILSFLVLGLSCAFFTGCGDTKVTGTVKKADGTPVTSGTMMYEDGMNSVIGPIKNGEFELYQINPGDGVPAGNYKGRVGVSDNGPGLGETAEQHKERLTKELGFSTKYLDFDSAGLTLTVEAGKPVPKMEIVLEP